MQALRDLIKHKFRGYAFFCIDNHVVMLASAIVDGTHHTLPSNHIHGTWSESPHDLNFAIRFTWRPLRIKAHAGFYGNELADVFAKWAVLALRVTHEHFAPPDPGTDLLGPAIPSQVWDGV